MGLIERLLIFLIMSCIVGILWLIIVRPILNYLEKKYGYVQDIIPQKPMPEELYKIQDEVEQDEMESELLEKKSELLEAAVKTKDVLFKNKLTTEKLEETLEKKRMSFKNTASTKHPDKQKKEI